MSSYIGLRIHCQDVRTYIEKQKKHHGRRSFQEEYLDFLKHHGVPYDPRYVFE